MNIGNTQEDREPLIMSKATGDPFITIRNEVKAQTEQIKVRHEMFQDLVKNCDTSSSTEFKDLRKGLVNDVRSADKKLKGLKQAIEMVEKNRQKFEQIKDAELATRKRFVDETQKVLNDVKAGMEAPSVRRKIEDDENKSRNNVFKSGSGTASVEVVERSKENDTFIKNNKLVQREMIDEQDENLGHLEKAVDTLGRQAVLIKEETAKQNIMLDDLQRGVDDADNKMSSINAALGKLLKTKDSCQIWSVVILSLILIILVLIVIFG